jgi:hypothetical protein
LQGRSIIILPISEQTLERARSVLYVPHPV